MKYQKSRLIGLIISGIILYFFFKIAVAQLAFNAGDGNVTVALPFLVIMGVVVLTLYLRFIRRKDSPVLTTGLNIFLLLFANWTNFGESVLLGWLWMYLLGSAVEFFTRGVFGTPDYEKTGRKYRKSGSSPRRDHWIYDTVNGSAPIPGAVNRVYGTAGASIAGAAEFGDAARLGAKGEVAVGEMLERVVAENPHTWLVHSVKFNPNKPGTTDIDHVLISGSNVYFIDAKWWAYGDYSWDGFDSDGNMIILENEVDKGRRSSMNAAMKVWTRHLDGVIARNVFTIETFIALAQPRRSGHSQYRVNNDRRPATSVRLISIESLYETLTLYVRHDASVPPQYRIINAFASKQVRR